MKLIHRLPLHKLCSAQAIAGGWPAPMFDGKHLVASNGKAAVWEPVEECSKDTVGVLVPKALIRDAHEMPASEAYLDVRKSGCTVKLFDGSAESYSATCQEEDGAVIADDLRLPAPPKRIRKGAVRLKIDAALLARLAATLGAGGRDPAIHLEMRADEDGEVRDPIRVSRYTDERLFSNGSDPIGQIMPWVGPVGGSDDEDDDEEEADDEAAEGEGESGGDS